MVSSKNARGGSFLRGLQASWKALAPSCRRPDWKSVPREGCRPKRPRDRVSEGGEERPDLGVGKAEKDGFGGERDPG